MHKDQKSPSCFHYREPLSLLQGHCFHYRYFLVNPCTSLLGIAVYKSQVSAWLARSMLKKALNFTKILILVLPCIFQEIAAKPPTLEWEGSKDPLAPL